MRVKWSAWATAALLAVGTMGCQGHLFPWANTQPQASTYAKHNAVTILPTEGMWVYNHLPEQRLREQFSFEVSQPWAKNLQLASVRMGASGAFVSPDGLILTNHHVAAGGLQNASGP